MANVEPTYYKLSATVKGGGMSMNDVHKALFNLERAVYAICNNLDEDSTGSADYLSLIGTDLRTAMTKLKLNAPKGSDTA